MADETKSKWTFKHILLSVIAFLLLAVTFVVTGGKVDFDTAPAIVMNGEVSKAGAELEGIPDDTKVPFNKDKVVPLGTPVPAPAPAPEPSN